MTQVLYSPVHLLTPRKVHTTAIAIHDFIALANWTISEKCNVKDSINRYTFWSGVGFTPVIIQESAIGPVILGGKDPVGYKHDQHHSGTRTGSIPCNIYCEFG